MIYNESFPRRTSTNSSYGHTEPISMSKCAGKCYYYNPYTDTINNIFAKYNTTITYTDKFNSAVVCNKDEPEEIVYEATCDFKDCFYKNENYNRKAIGLRLYVDETPWIATINQHIYSCTGHYNLYLSSFNEGNENITLTPTNTKICNAALDNGEYNFNINDSDPYIRIAD